MMKKRMLSVLLLLALMLITACGPKAPVLEGRYVSSTRVAETNYEFKKDGSVTVKIVTGGKVVMEEAGTYAINEEGTEITFTFPDTQVDLGIFSIDMPNPSGTYTYTEGDGYIQVGSTMYEKATK